MLCRSECLDFMLNTVGSNWRILNTKTTCIFFLYIKIRVATVLREALREAKEEMEWLRGC